MEDTSGFYKQTEDGWSFAPNFVETSTYTLTAEMHETYTYPVDGWEWFDTAPQEYILWTILNQTT